MAQVMDQQGQGQSVQSQRQLQQMYQQVLRAIDMYHSNPDSFQGDSLRQLKGAADQFGIPFTPNFSATRAINKGLYEAGRGLTLGLLPKSLDPGAMNQGEQLAGGLGKLVGLATPIGIGMSAGKAALGEAGTLAAGKGIESLGEEGSIMKWIQGIGNDKVKKHAAALAGLIQQGATSPLVTGAAGRATSLFGGKALQYGVGAGAALASRNLLSSDEDDESQQTSDTMNY